MNELLEIRDFFQQCGMFFLATAEGGQPRVRPFGSLVVFEGRLYLNTNNQKAVFAQMMANPKVELCGFSRGVTLRVSGTIVRDERPEPRERILEENPGLKHMYAVGDGRFEALYLENASATYTAMGKPTRTIKF